MKDKVGIYCRLSEEDRYKKDKSDDSESIANQKSMLLKYALSHNWEVINVYSDDDWSGADINRPQFQRLIEDCKNGLINIVLCKTQSRFSRDMEVVENIFTTSSLNGEFVLLVLLIMQIQKFKEIRKQDK